MTGRVRELWPYNGNWNGTATLFRKAHIRTRQQTSSYIWRRMREYPWWELRIDRLTFVVRDAAQLELQR